MIKVLEQLEDDYYLVLLEDTKYYQIWNRWDLYETLLESNKCVTLQLEDFPMNKSDIIELVNKIKQNKEN